jgi:hypothetical protein
MDILFLVVCLVVAGVMMSVLTAISKFFGK